METDTEPIHRYMNDYEIDRKLDKLVDKLIKLKSDDPFDWLHA